MYVDGWMIQEEEGEGGEGKAGGKAGISQSIYSPVNFSCCQTPPLFLPTYLPNRIIAYSENSKLIIQLLFKYSKQNNSSLILVTHDQSIAKECDKIIEIKDGKII